MFFLERDKLANQIARLVAIVVKYNLDNLRRHKLFITFSHSLTTSLFVRASNSSADSVSSGISEDESDAWYLDDTCGFAVFFVSSDTAENAAMV